MWGKPPKRGAYFAKPSRLAEPAGEASHDRCRAVRSELVCEALRPRETPFKSFCLFETPPLWHGTLLFRKKAGARDGVLITDGCRGRCGVRTILPHGTQVATAKIRPRHVTNLTSEDGDGRGERFQQGVAEIDAS